MITTPTVFVLGAGASMPYAYPSGEDLINRILHELHPKKPIFKEFMALDYSTEFIKKFCEYLSRSGRYSIDAFLEHSPEFREIGKLAIARILTPQESHSMAFFNKQTNPQSPKKSIKNDDWYRYLFNHMNTHFDKFNENKISFITFNYDRSLEYYLYDALKHSYPGKTEKEYADKLKSIHIIHMYGKLDHLPWEYWESGKKRTYGEIPSGEGLKKSSQGINIIHENFDATKFKSAHDLLNNALRIYFIGLNLLNKINLERLNILDYIKYDSISGNSVCGTAYGIETAEINSIKKYFGVDPVFKGLSLGKIDEDALLFLRRRVIL